MNQIQALTTMPPTSKRLRRLLQWAHDDLNNPVIRSSADRLKQEREITLARLAPHIEELVALAMLGLKAQDSDGSSRSAP